MTVRWLTIFLDLPPDRYETEVAFWARVTGSSVSPARGEHGQFATLVPAAGDPAARVQRLDDACPRSTADGGCHLDLHVDDAFDDGPADGTGDGTAVRAQELGARLVHREPGLRILESPGGFRFCISGWRGEATVPVPSLVDGVGPSSANQLCLDIPADRFEAECTFWESLTGWPLRHDPQSEFGYLERPAGMPVRLLLQRRDTWGPDDVVTGHVDIAAGDAREDLAAVHLRLGALSATPLEGGWTAMLDPAGRPYCLTGRNPVTGRMGSAFPGPDPLLR